MCALRGTRAREFLDRIRNFPPRVRKRYLHVMRVSDTTPRAAELQLELYRSVGPAERVAIAVALSEATRETALAGIRRRHPEYSEREVGEAFIAMVYGARRTT